jgi:hypothetical protein
MGKYDDIIHLPHHVSDHRAPMSMMDRAAQFSPFAALTGYEAAIAEATRLTDRRIELDENRRAELNERIRIIQDNINTCPPVTITYFEEDLRKTGGAYVSVTGRVGKISAYERSVIMEDGLEIPFEDVLEIEGPIF